jgi:hypothetical protein
MRNLTRFFAGAVIALALGVVACDSGPVGVRTGYMNLLLTDAPGDIDQAVVTIESIYLVGGGSDSDTTSVDSSNRVVVWTGPMTVDLLTLQDSLAALIDSAEIPEGNYRQLRFVVSGGYISVIGTDTTTRQIFASSPEYEGLPDGAVVTGELQMPSYASSGLKVTLPAGSIQIVANTLVTLVADFDVSQSFGKAAGGSNRWVMTPVIRATIPAAP